MPRRAREKSESGIYHIILRGANKQKIFHEDQDNEKFIEILAKYKKVSGIKVYGWCLMGNHVHILIEQGKEEISVTMKRIGVSYARYYNWKYNSTGHLFQDRYKSEKVEDDGYLLTVIRYIHQNPVKAGMVKRVSDWKWSSCNVYYGNVVYPEDLLDIELILGMFSEERETAIKSFVEFNEGESRIECLEDDSGKRLTDEEAKREIFKIIPLEEIVLIKSMPKGERDKLISKIKEIKGISQRQAARILGVAPNLIIRTRTVHDGSREPSP
jgi:REP element-mobilizing transposase RayT